MHLYKDMHKHAHRNLCSLRLSVCLYVCLTVCLSDSVCLWSCGLSVSLLGCMRVYLPVNGSRSFVPIPSKWLASGTDDDYDFCLFASQSLCLAGFHPVCLSVCIQVILHFSLFQRVSLSVCTSVSLLVCLIACTHVSFCLPVDLPVNS